MRSVHLVGRGAAVGAAVVTATCAAIAAENLHTGARVLEWTIGVVLIGLPLIAICVVLRLTTGAAAWVLRRVQARAPAVVTRVSGPIVAGLDLVERPWLGTLLGIGLMVWGSPADGAIALYHGLFYFEILIVIGAVVGALIGLALAFPRTVAGRPRHSASAVLLSAGILAVATAGWAVTPGQGDAILREDPASIAAIPALGLPDPSLPGPYAVMSTSYGSGHDRRRAEYGADVGWVTPTVDASSALGGRGHVPDLYAQWLWGFDRAHLPLNALAWYPKDAPGRRPLVLIVHGNHAAADFSDPGYAYLGKHLAGRGYIVASVDENYLNGDAFFDYAGAEMGVRAWLLLRHIELFRTWDKQPSHPLEGRVDLDRVALIGHSRGGEAAAVASVMATDLDMIPPGLPAVGDAHVRSVVAFAPSDGMYSGPGAPVRPRDIDYLVMQGAHDGDLPGYAGLRTYHRVGFDPGTDHIKVAMFSERANHGRFNSVWDIGDAGPLPSWLLDRGSLLSTAEQQRLAKTAVTAFLARSLEGDMAYEAFFREPRSGRHWLPDDVIETHWESASRVAVEMGESATDPTRSVGFDSSSAVDPRLRDGVPQNDRAIALRWSGPASFTVPFETELASRVGQGDSLVFSMSPWVDAGGPVDALIELEFRGRIMTSVRMSAVSASRPLLPARIWKIDGLGDRYLPGEKRVLGAERFAQTHELPLAPLLEGAPGADVADLRAIRFSFEGTGSVLLDDFGFEPAVGALLQ